MYQNVNCISIWLFLKVFGPIVPKPELHCRCNDGAKKSQSFIKLTFEFTLYSEVYCFQYCCTVVRVSVQGVKSLSGHLDVYAGVWFLWSKKKLLFFKKKKETLLIVSIVKVFKNSTNLLLWPAIYWNKCAITRSESTPRRLTLPRILVLGLTLGI